MTARRFLDRLLTVVVTATLTSAAWIVAGSVYFGPRQEAASPSSAPTTTLDAALIEPAAGGEVGDLLIPVQGVEASELRDTFSDRRGGGEQRHEALDIMAPVGTPVVAAAAGKVEKLFKSEAGGNTIYIRSQDRRTIHYYAHLDAYAPGLGEGQGVRRGQRLGTVGSTGNADPAAPHLHFAVLRTRPDAQWWEPAAALNPYSRLVRGN